MSGQGRCKLRTDQLLLLLALLAYANCAAAWTDVRLELGPGVYNPSLVVYQGSAWAVARSTQLKWDTTGLKWIVNRAHLCQVNTADWTTLSCHDFDPWRGRYGQQCRWGNEDWKVPWEAWGVDDTKLFVWPGHGLWALTGRRPQRGTDSKYCPQVIWRQWLLQLAAEGVPVAPSAFAFPPQDTIQDVEWPAPRPARALTAAASAAGGTAGVVTAGGVTVTAAAGDAETGRQAGSSAGVSTQPAAAGSDVHANSTTATATTLAEAAAFRASVGAAQVVLHQRQLLQQELQGEASTPTELPPTPPESWMVHRHKRHRRRRRHRMHPKLVGLEPDVRTAINQPATQPETPTAPAAAAAVPAATSVVPTGPSAAAPAPAPAPEQLQVLLPDTSAANAPLSGSSSPSSNRRSWADYREAQPVPLAIKDAAAVYGKGYALVEKNWMPFVWEGKLLVSYSVSPQHRVYQLQPDGSAELLHATDTGNVFAPLGGAAAGKMHGGPPLVLINPQLMASSQGGSSSSSDAAAAAQDGSSSSSSGSHSTAQQAYYLGVAHHWEAVSSSGSDGSSGSNGSGKGGSSHGRLYRHYLIKVEAQPPFRVLQVSKQLPLQQNGRYKHVAFVSGLAVAMLPPGSAAIEGPHVTTTAVAASAAADSTGDDAAAADSTASTGDAAAADGTGSTGDAAAAAAATDATPPAAIVQESGAEAAAGEEDAADATADTQAADDADAGADKQEAADAAAAAAASDAAATNADAASPPDDAAGAAAAADAPAASVDDQADVDAEVMARRVLLSGMQQQRQQHSQQRNPQPQQQQHSSRQLQRSIETEAAASEPPAAPVAAAAAAAGSDSTGSLVSDADADDFTWEVSQHPSDVNTFSWVALGPSTQPTGEASKQAAAAAATGPAKAAGPAAATPAAAPSATAAVTPTAQQPASQPPKPQQEKPAGPSTKQTQQKQKEEEEVLLPSDPPLSLEGPSAATAAVAAGDSKAGQLEPHVIISYGSGDWESRVAVLTLPEVEQLFDSAVV